jgi:hypothetical protein
MGGGAVNEFCSDAYSLLDDALADDGRLWSPRIQDPYADENGHCLLVAGRFGRILGVCSLKAVVEIVGERTLPSLMRTLEIKVTCEGWVPRRYGE